MVFFFYHFSRRCDAEKWEITAARPVHNLRTNVNNYCAQYISGINLYVVIHVAYRRYFQITLFL